MVEEGNHSAPLAISQVDVDTRIFGFVAETRMTLVFRNRQSRPLAGDLYFPLPDGATVSGYALDVNGTMVDGVVVEKDRGRQVFEKEVRKGVDPGLIEWTRGNHFKTRVFPIPARGSRTVRVNYLSDVLTDARGSHYLLPLNFKEKLALFHLRLEVVRAQAKPVIQQGGPPGLEFGKWRESYVAETSHTNASLQGDLVLDLPQVQQQRVLVEKAGDGQYYFCVNDFPINPRPAPTKPTLPPLSQVTIFWDASGSRGATDHQRELGWLKSWFATYSRFAMTVNLVPFRNSLAPAQRFVLTNGESSVLLDAITKIDYDGGTQIGCLSNFPAPAPGGCYFLFSDGLSNFGQPEPPALDAPLYVFTADQTVNRAFLEYLAQRSGGAEFPLQRMTDRQVLAAMASRPYAFISTDSTTPGAADLYPRLAPPLQKRFTLVGKLSDSQARIVLNYGTHGKILSRSRFDVSRTGAVEGERLRRLWAQKKLEDLLVFQKQNEAEITDLGRQYGLVTPFTSLIVLESLDQYVEHRILPPTNLPGMRAKYARVMEDRLSKEKKEKKDKLEHLLALWNKRVEWWNTGFKYAEGFKYRDREKDQSRRAVHVTDINGPAVSSVNPAASQPPTEGAAIPERAGPALLDLVPATTLAQEGAAHESAPGIAIKEWDPSTPYVQALKKSRPQDAFATYLLQRKKYAASPAFYLDCAEFFRKQKQDAVGIQVLSNLAELELENAGLLRVLAYRLQQIGQLDLACGLFDQVLRLRPEEPAVIPRPCPRIGTALSGGWQSRRWSPRSGPLRSRGQQPVGSV